MSHQATIREEELKNRVAALYFGKYDCARIVGNIDFCVSLKGGSRTGGPPSPAAADAQKRISPALYWAEAKNHPTDVYRMLAQLILTIGRAAVPGGRGRAEARPSHDVADLDSPPRFVGCFYNEKIAFVEYHYILPVFNLNDFNWTQTPSAVDDKTVATVRRAIPTDKVFVFRDGEGAVATQFTSTVADVYDRDGEYIGTKTIFSPDGRRVLMDWIRQFYDRSGEHLAYCRYLGSDFQNNNGVFITLSPSANDLKQVKGNWITPANVGQFCVYFATRICIEADWLNDRDQFLFPNDGWMSDIGFQSDCLVFTLFSGQNRVKSADGVNHWIPFTEEEVGAKSCFKSHFMSDFINGRASCPHAADTRRVEDNASYQSELELSTTPPNPVNPVNPVEKHSAPLRLCARENISPAACAVLDAGRELWRYYHAQPEANPNASYYDIRAHFQGCKPNGAMNAKSSDATYNALVSALRTAHKALAAQIEPKVYEYGFLKR